MMSISTLFLAIFALQISWAYAERSLSVLLNGPSEVVDVDNFTITANITNTGDITLKLYNEPKSLLSKFPGDSFIFPSGNNTPSFIGALAYYSFENNTDFLVLEPGQSTSVLHDLGAAYRFTTPGTYEVNANPNFYFYDPDTQQPVSIVATSSGHTATLSGSLVSSIHSGNSFREFKRSGSLDSERMLAKRDWDSHDCTDSQVDDIAQGISDVHEYARDAIDYLSSGARGPRFTHWFGPYRRRYRDYIMNHYTQLLNLDTYSFTCCAGTDRICALGITAYVFPDDYPYVYLCPLFWPHPPIGDDSKAGILIHEASHFTVNGGTSDYAYGKDQSHYLAIHHVAQALDNADNYRLFAENTPPLS